MYLRQLQQWGFPGAMEFLTGSYRPPSGDVVAMGKGELLYWQA
jgi:hypothetical protein